MFQCYSKEKFVQLKNQFINELRKKILEIVEEEFNKVIDKYEKRTTILLLIQNINFLYI